MGKLVARRCGMATYTAPTTRQAILRFLEGAL